MIATPGPGVVGKSRGSAGGAAQAAIGRKGMAVGRARGQIVRVARIVIAAREGLLRASLRFLLERQDGVGVVADASSGGEAVAAAARLQPDVVLMDVALDGIEATRRIRAVTEAAVLVLLPAGGEEMFAALRAGARGLLLMDAGPAELVEAVRIVAAGGTVLGPPLAAQLVEDFLSRPERLSSTPAELDELTAREREVVALVACGLSNEQIAERLVVTYATAKTHVSRALTKLHARDRAQLVVLAYECGLVSPGPHWSPAADASLGFADRIPRIAA
jgi:DNA-binding NarL/FixJ family response regulator